MPDLPKDLFQKVIYWARDSSFAKIKLAGMSNIVGSGHIVAHIRYLECRHYSDVIISAMSSEIIGVSMLYPPACSAPDQRMYQSSASFAFVRVIHRCPVDSPHKGPITRKIIPLHDVIMRRGELWHDYSNRRKKNRKNEIFIRIQLSVHKP